MDRTKKKKLYFVGVLPDPDTILKIKDIKNYIAQTYNSKASLRSPPHITMHMPFWEREENENSLIKGLKHFSRQQMSFNLELKDFGAFPPRVIFINVVENDLLRELKRNLYHFLKKEFRLFDPGYDKRGFHPHVTVAFRDLKPGMFRKAWEEFQRREFTSKSHCQELTLLKHNGKVWDIYRNFNFKN